MNVDKHSSKFNNEIKKLAKIGWILNTRANNQELLTGDHQGCLPSSKCESLYCEIRSLTYTVIVVAQDHMFLLPSLHSWFVRNRKSLFLESVIQSAARFSLGSTGLYYQNYITSIHATEKRCQNFEKERLGWLLATFRKSFNSRKKTKSVPSMGQATITCLRNTGNSS